VRGMEKNKKKVVKRTSKKEKIDKKKTLKNIEEIVIDAIAEEKSEAIFSRPNAIEDILFKLPIVSDPIVGTPQQVQKDLDKIVKRVQKDPDSVESRHQFNRIHLYMHGYLINIVLKQFPYIRGMQTTDIYQQTLIALWSKAIPGFKKGKGMSFLNFAKMCIRRHLITLLNTSTTRQKDQSINRAISLDSPINQGDEDSNNTFSNTVADTKQTDKITEQEEAFSVTKNSLLGALSDFEKIVLQEYLATSTYREIAKNVSRVTKKRCVPKSVDNALLRIRKKAISLKRHSSLEDIPLFIIK
jgi:RNA polymerase sporulation-specific sigma factor